MTRRNLSRVLLAGVALAALMHFSAANAAAQVPLRYVNPRAPVFVPPVPLAVQEATLANTSGKAFGGVGPLASSQFGAIGAGTGGAMGGNAGASAFGAAGGGGTAAALPMMSAYLGYNGMQGPVPRLTATNPNAVSAVNQTGALGVGTGIGGFGSPLGQLGGIGGIGGGQLGGFGGSGLGGFGGGGLGGFGGGGLGGFGGGGLGGIGSPFGGLGGGGLGGLGGGFPIF